MAWCVAHAVFRMHLAEHVYRLIVMTVTVQAIRDARNAVNAIEDYRKMRSMRGNLANDQAINDRKLIANKAWRSLWYIHWRHLSYLIVSELLACNFCQGVWTGTAIYLATSCSIWIIPSSALANYMIPAKGVSVDKLPWPRSDCKSCRMGNSDPKVYDADGNVIHDPVT